jgi:hypothetical protein
MWVAIHLITQSEAVVIVSVVCDVSQAKTKRRVNKI